MFLIIDSGLKMITISVFYHQIYMLGNTKILCSATCTLSFVIHAYSTRYDHFQKPNILARNIAPTNNTQKR